MITKDTYLMFTSGTYEDWGIDGIVKAIKDFDIVEALGIWKKQEAMNTPVIPNLSSFPIWLDKQGYVEILSNMEEVYIDPYPDYEYKKHDPPYDYRVSTLGLDIKKPLHL